MAVGGRQKTSQQPVFNVEPFLSLNLYISLLFTCPKKIQFFSQSMSWYLSAIVACLSKLAPSPDKTMAKWMKSSPISLMSHGSTNWFLMQLSSRLLSSWLCILGENRRIVSIGRRKPILFPTRTQVSCPITKTDLGDVLANDKNSDRWCLKSGKSALDCWKVIIEGCAFSKWHRGYLTKRNPPLVTDRQNRIVGLGKTF